MTPRSLIEPARLAGGAVLRSQSDARLVDLVRAGNDRAFEAIVSRYRRPLLRYCGRILSSARAEDAVQQAFLNSYRAMKADERAIDLRPWLYRIAHNASLNVLRAAGPATTQIDEQIDGVERPEQAFERRERLSHLVAAVQSLPPRQRDAIILREIEGRSYDEIATELRVSDGAVRQLLNRARTTLRAGATAVVPEALIVRLATGGGGEPVAARVAELVAAGGGGAIVLKAGTAVVVAGAVATGPGPGPRQADDGRVEKQPARAAAATPAPAPAPPTTTTSNGRAAAERRDEEPRRAVRTRAETAPTPARRSDGTRRATPRGRDDDRRSGSDDRPADVDDDDRSGPGDGTVVADDDSSGPAGGSDDDDRSGSNSGPGSGRDDPVPVPAVPDPPDDDSHSGPGGDANFDSSGPGSGRDDDR